MLSPSPQSYEEAAQNTADQAKVFPLPVFAKVPNAGPRRVSFVS